MGPARAPRERELRSWPVISNLEELLIRYELRKPRAIPGSTAPPRGNAGKAAATEARCRGGGQGRAGGCKGGHRGGGEGGGRGQGQRGGGGERSKQAAACEAVPAMCARSCTRKIPCLFSFIWFKALLSQNSFARLANCANNARHDAGSQDGPRLTSERHGVYTPKTSATWRRPRSSPTRATSWRGGPRSCRWRERAGRRGAR